ncbi:dual specificity protein phosphatase family protein [Blastopirellula marina]|uniref:Protein phosphatase n=1 Tax=Blastopirellula marina TaxID=124 RepID=A0A2S8GRK4_9BACT|nr:dual specificity protein phosphatase [Blastopirellula marina]PQO47058.1 protein phosphatase [Blastopirellula marina]
MREILSDRLWIANALQIRDIRNVLLCGVTAVVDLAMEEKPIVFPRDIVYVRMPITDGAGNPRAILKATWELVAELIEAERPTAVACSAGMSRSPVIVAAALAKVEKKPLKEVILRMAEMHPLDVSPALLQDVMQPEPGTN